MFEKTKSVEHSDKTWTALTNEILERISRLEDNTKKIKELNEELKTRCGAMFDVDIVILCGGEGTRVRHITGDIPKCVYSVNGKPFLYYVLTHFLKYRDYINKFILCCSDKSYLIRNELLKLPREFCNWTFQEQESIAFHSKKIYFATEDKPSGTMGAMKSALPYVTGDYVLVINGDTFCPVDLIVLRDWHIEGRRHWTLVSHDYIHTGVWLMTNDFFKMTVTLDYEDREMLIPCGTRAEVMDWEWSQDRPDVIMIPAYYEGPSFVDIGTPEGMEKAQQMFV